MSGYILSAVLGILLVWTFWRLLVYYRRSKMLFQECVDQNHRWRFACEVLIRKGIKEAIRDNRRWTNTDEMDLREYAAKLEAAGMSLKSLGMSDKEIYECTGRLVH